MTNPILETRNLTKIYGSNIIFKDINLKVNEGETIVIIGPSGTGKSTLLRCINLLTQHDGGQVFLDGIPGQDQVCHCGGLKSAGSGFLGSWGWPLRAQDRRSTDRF